LPPEFFNDRIKMGLITLIRHGETTWNAAHRVQGQLESPLSARGLQQAEALASRLGRNNIEALYASDLSRAHDTAKKIAAVSGVEISVDERLRERHYGVFQGLTWDEIRVRFPDDHARYKSLFPGVTIPGGESVEDFAERVFEVCGDIAERHGHAIVVAHGGLVDVLYRRASGIPLQAPRDYPLPNASINRFRYDGRWHVESFGDVEHLAPMDL
jgi:2,3-bisphosphoglycerate-dependent phosphoglycerate mutase